MQRQPSILGLRDAGRPIPDEVAIVGLGDLEVGRLMRPALSTIRIDGMAIGRAAAALTLGTASDTSTWGSSWWSGGASETTRVRARAKPNVGMLKSSNYPQAAHLANVSSSCTKAD
jgi:Periplasmic binding protein-like domain